MKLYDGGRAPNPRRVRIFLAEKGISVPLQPVNIGAMEQRSPDYARINPMQRVPALVLDNGTVIAESVAICRYFEATQPDPALFGTGAEEMALVEMWNRRIEFNLFQPISFIFRHGHPAMKAMEVPQVAPWAEANRPRVTDFLKFLDGELAGRPFIAGNTFSIADITALCAVDFMRPARLDVPAEYEHVHRWHGEVAQRPSAKA
jgi:glutathione S-transferase